MLLYLHLFNEGSEVVGCFMRILHHLEIIHISSSIVPVHHDEINVFPDQQQLCDEVQPIWGRSSGPVPMDDKGGGSGQVELGVGGQVGVGNERATGGILPGVQQQPNFEVGSNDGVTEI